MAVKTKKDSISTMDALVERFEDKLVPFKAGDATEVTVLETTPRKVLVDIAGLAVGLIPDQEFSFDTSELKPGDKVIAYVLSMENDNGYVILSHKRANREALWQTLEDKSKSGEIMTVKVVGANRGGLLVEAGGIDGFIPVSQLSSEHYPRIQNGSGGEIARRLQEMISQTLKVKVLSVDKNANKLIFSEKMTQDLLSESNADTVKIGDILEGTVTGIVPFGVFISADGVEGLIHISEISWDRVTNINSIFEVGQKIKIKVIQIDGNRVSFSVKRLQPDPWIRAYEQYKPGAIIEGEVTRVTNFGAFVKLSDHVAGLCHLSQLGENIEDPNKVVRVGEKYKFKLINIEPATHRCSLQLVDSDTPVKKSEETNQKSSGAPPTRVGGAPSASSGDTVRSTSPFAKATGGLPRSHSSPNRSLGHSAKEGKTLIKPPKAVKKQSPKKKKKGQ